MKNLNKAFAVCGIIAPIFYLLMAVIGGALILGYSHLSETVSELLVAGAPNRPLLATLMIISSVLGILFPIGLHRGINEGKGSKVGPAFLIIASVLTLFTTYFPQDPGGPPVTFAGTVHVVLIIPMVILSLGAFLAFWRRLKSDSRWSGYDKYSLVTFIIAIPLGVISAVSLDSPYVGLLERLSVGVILQWGFFMAIKLFRLSK
ncbi:DUF998 domain-containing protein [Chloroflexota bacterium]